MTPCPLEDKEQKGLFTDAGQRRVADGWSRPREADRRRPDNGGSNGLRAGECYFELGLEDGKGSGKNGPGNGWAGQERMLPNGLGKDRSRENGPGDEGPGEDRAGENRPREEGAREEGPGEGVDEGRGRWRRWLLGGEREDVVDGVAGGQWRDADSSRNLGCRVGNISRHEPSSLGLSRAMGRVHLAGPTKAAGTGMRGMAS